MKVRYFILLFLIVIFFNNESPGQDIVLHLEKSVESKKIENNLKEFITLDDKLEISDLLLKGDSIFKRPKKKIPSYGYTDKTIWLKIVINFTVNTKKLYYLEIDNPIIDSVTIHAPYNHNFKSYALGDLYKFSKRPVKYRNIIFPLNLTFGKNIIFLKIQTSSNSNIPLTLWTPNAFHERNEEELPVLWLYYGLMIAMLFYNLFIFFSIRDKSYLFYVLFIFGFVFFRLAYNGLAFQFIWSSNTWWANACVPFFVSFLALNLILFSRLFLNIKENSKILDYILLALGGFYLVSLTFPILGSYAFAIRSTLGVSVLTLIVLMISSILSLKNGSKEALFYLIAWTFFLIGSMLNILRDFGVLPHNFLTIWGQQIGSALQVLLLSLGLADRINTMRSQVEKSHDDLLSLNSALDKEREQLAVTLRSIGDAVFTMNLLGEITYINRAAERIMSQNRIDVLYRHIDDVLKFENVDGHLFLIQELFLSTGLSEIREAKLLENDKNVEFTIAPISDMVSNTIGYILVMRDITDRKNMEKEIVQRNKLDALGTLAGGIAHDFNNILTALTGNIGLAKLLCEEKGDAYKILFDAERASYRARGLTQQLLAFAQGGAPIKKVFSFDELIIDTVNFTMSGSTYSVNFDIQDDLWQIVADEGQIGQAINNLVLNAKNYMPKGGLLEVTAVNAIIENGHPSLLSGEFVHVAIKDNGPGIPKQIINRIFDPFFTTRSSGSGLGLASAYSILKNHGGFITAGNCKPHGAIFDLYLPAQTEGVFHEKVNNEFSEARAGEGKILLMDDEELILKTTGKILQHLSYDVVAVQNGEEAIEAYKNEKFDLVILDLTIQGGMGGKETLENLLELDPKVKAIASSGYSNDKVMSNFDEYGFVDVMEKPYTVDILSGVIQRVLNRDDL